VSSLPELAPGTRVRLELAAVDLLERSVTAVYKETLGAAPVTIQEGDAEAR
jgi:hypothetical protein